jgi:hypothetical protein
MKDLDENKENFEKVCKEIIERFSAIPYSFGDASDIGNEMAIIVSKHFSDEIGWDKQSFLGGIDHGIKLNEK